MNRFWLSHHFPEDFDRCYRLGSTHLCARCLGTYPTVFAALIAQIATHAPLAVAAWVELLIGIGLFLPATIDWLIGQANPHRGTNAWRTFTGILLGIALGRSLFIHLHRPFPWQLIAQGALAGTAGFLVVLRAYVRQRR